MRNNLPLQPQLSQGRQDGGIYLLAGSFQQQLVAPPQQPVMKQPGVVEGVPTFVRSLEPEGF